MDLEAGSRAHTHTHRTQLLEFFLLHVLYFKTFDLNFDVEAAGERDFYLFLRHMTHYRDMQLEFGFLCMVFLENMFGALGCLCGP